MCKTKKSGEHVSVCLFNLFIKINTAYVISFNVSHLNTRTIVTCSFLCEIQRSIAINAKRQ